MRSLLTPWRYDYLTGARSDGECVFCSEPHRPDAENLIVHRAAHNFIILNRYPYANGHLMIVPHDHIALPSRSTPAQRAEMFELAAVCEAALRECYKVDGINLGMNLGRAAGAGIEDHFHLHVVPRWDGDTNFMAVTAETRIIPEDFRTTRTRLATIVARLLGPKAGEGP